MDAESLLNFEPQELIFPFERNRQSSCKIILFNKTNNHVAYKMLTTNTRKYVVRPRIGVLLPGSDCEITVIMRAEREAPRNIRCRDKFMVKSAVARPGATTEDAREMFHEESHAFRNNILRVIYISPPPELPSPVSDTQTESSFEEPGIENADPDASEVNDSGVEPRDDPVQVIDSGVEPHNDAAQVIVSGVEPHNDAAQVIDSGIEPHDNVEQTSAEKILQIHPEKLQFSVELNKEVCCSLKLSNTTENYVAFMVKIASDKYSVRPNIGIISPQSACDITVRMLAQSEVHLDMECEGKFLIQSLAVIPSTTIEQINPGMFEKGGSTVEEHEVQVVNILKKDKNDNQVAELVVKAVVSCLLGLLSWYLMRRTLSFIWSLAMIVIMLLMKMVKRLVSDSVEDWVVKTLLYIIMHFVLRRKENVRMS